MNVVEQTLQAVLQGLPVGAVFALIAVGFVLAYKTSGVFNLAFGAQAYVSAAAYYELHVRRELPIWLSLLLAVGVLAPALGLAMEALVFRHLRGSTPLAKLVASLGLLIAIPPAFNLLTDFDRTGTFGVVGIVADGQTVYRLFGRYPITRDELVQLVVAVGGAALLVAVLRWTRLGLQVRAVVESPRMTAQRGVAPDRVSAVAWALSSLFAGLAGVLLAPRYVAIEPTSYFQVIVVAIAAAAIGRLTSIPWALAGGLGLGILTTLLATFLDPSALLARQLGPSLPFIVLFAVVVLVPSLRSADSHRDPLGGVDPPPPASTLVGRSPAVVRGFRMAGVALCAVAVLWTLVAAEDLWVLAMTETAIFAVIFLSITVFTGIGGQVSLAQAAFASIGAFTVMQLADRFDLSVLAGMFIGAGIATLVGVLLALPVLRLGGVWLALSTLAFAMFYDAVLAKLDWVGGTSLQRADVPRPLLGPIDFADDRAYFLLCVVVLVIVGIGVLRLARGTVGQVLRALRADEAAAQSVGIVPWRSRVLAFGLSAGVAGLGGALLAIRQGTVTYEVSFSPFVGLFWVLIVVALSGRTVAGAVLAAVALRILPELGASLGGGTGPWMALIFGLMAVGYARHPEGVAAYAVHRIEEGVTAVVRRAGADAPLPPVAEDAPA